MLFLIQEWPGSVLDMTRGHQRASLVAAHAYDHHKFIIGTLGLAFCCFESVVYVIFEQSQPALTQLAGVPGLDKCL